VTASDADSQCDAPEPVVHQHAGNKLDTGRFVLMSGFSDTTKSPNATEEATFKPERHRHRIRPEEIARELADDAAQPVTLGLLSFKKCNMKASAAGKKVKFEV
jgi:hypothetical protein